MEDNTISAPFMTEESTTENAVYFTEASIEHAASSTDLFAQTILYYTIGAFALIGNLFVVMVIFQYTKMRQVLTNVYVINQSLIDGLAGLILILQKTFQFHFDRPLWGVAGEVYCRVWVAHIPLFSILISSTFNLLALTLERYVSVVYPIIHRVSFTSAKVKASLAVVWLSGLVLQMSYKIPTSGLTYDGRCLILQNWPSAIYKKVVGSSLVFIEFFLPLTLITFCYTRMIIMLKVKVAPVSQGQVKDTGSGDQGDVSLASRNAQIAERNQLARRNILKTLIIVSICFSLCWVWNESYYFLTNIGVLNLSYRNPFNTFSVICIYLNCCINPIIYIIHYDQFRKALKLLRRRLFYGKSSFVSSQTNQTSST